MSEMSRTTFCFGAAAGTSVIVALAPFFSASISALVKPTRETQPMGEQKVNG